MSLKGDIIAVGLAGAVLLAAGWYAKKKAADAADALAKSVQDAMDAATVVVTKGVDAVDKAVSWPILTAGDAIGIPRTSMTACEKAKAAGSAWDASFACPASDFLSYVFN
jgi:hypothetical protein